MLVIHAGRIAQWVDVENSGAIGTIEDGAGHLVSDVLPHHFQFDGASHFVFDHPEAFDFAGDFSVQAQVQ